MTSEHTLFQLGQHFKLSIHPNTVPDLRITGVNALDRAGSTEISFLSNKKHLKHAESSQAAAIISAQPIPNKTCLISKDPYLAYAQMAQHFHPRLLPSGQNIHPRATIDPSVSLPDDITIEAGVVIGADCQIGAFSTLHANCVLQDSVSVGAHTIISPLVTVHKHCTIGSSCLIGAGTVIGSDGFGYAPVRSNKTWYKIPQIGSVIIGDHVEIGSNCSIDRGASHNTFIDDHVIIDNLVHIAHNVKIGRATAIAGQVGIAGSTSIGENCQFSGQVGINGHITIGNDVIILGQAMVTNHIAAAGVYAGAPCQPVSQWRKNTVINRNIAKHIAAIKQSFKASN